MKLNESIKRSMKQKFITEAKKADDAHIDAELTKIFNLLASPASGFGTLWVQGGGVADNDDEFFKDGYALEVLKQEGKIIDMLQCNPDYNYNPVGMGFVSIYKKGKDYKLVIDFSPYADTKKLFTIEAIGFDEINKTIKIMKPLGQHIKKLIEAHRNMVDFLEHTVVKGADVKYGFKMGD